jgi:hypothetical protein
MAFHETHFKIIEMHFICVYGYAAAKGSRGDRQSENLLPAGSSFRHTVFRRRFAPPRSKCNDIDKSGRCHHDYA